MGIQHPSVKPDPSTVYVQVVEARPEGQELLRLLLQCCGDISKASFKRRMLLHLYCRTLDAIVQPTDSGNVSHDQELKT